MIDPDWTWNELEEYALRLEFGLETILHQPSPHRNPDGDDDYVEAVRLIATEALRPV